jgi:2-polyprenyl-3-methyl-5-hydroxy-6-metoxy-1,4-benzoquinol methylase
MTQLQYDLRDFFAKQVGRDQVSDALRTSRLEWRLACFTTAQRYAKYINDRFFDIRKKRVLDLACGWGGHAMAFASEGATVICSDVSDYKFSEIQRFARERDITLATLRGDCQKLPFKDNSFDIILALDVIEHIGSVSGLAGEVGRLLRSGGICLVTSPPRLHSLMFGEPHWGLRGIALLPLVGQRLVATNIFKRTYPYPITRQYTLASQLIRPFNQVGLKGTPFIEGRLEKALSRSPLLRRAFQEVLWSFVALNKT